MHELRNHNVSIGYLHEHTYPPVVFRQVLRTVNPQNSEQKPTTKNFAGFHNHLPLLTTV